MERKVASKKRHPSIDESTRNEESQPESEAKPLLMPFPHHHSSPEKLDEWYEELVSTHYKSFRKHEEAAKIRRVVSQRQTPRYLFRACLMNGKSKTGSGGVVCLDRILPSSFRVWQKHGKEIPTLSQLPHNDLLHHLRVQKSLGDKEGPLFSSWSSDLGKAARAAKTLSRSIRSSGKAKVYLVVLDLEHLSSYNDVVPIELCLELGIAWPQGGDNNELLVYGPLSGGAFRAVEFDGVRLKFLDHVDSFAPKAIVRLFYGTPTIEQQATEALTFGSKFGSDFALPVAAMAMSLLPGNEELHSVWNADEGCQEMHEALKVFKYSSILSSWVWCSTGTSGRVAKYTTSAAERGEAFLEALTGAKKEKKSSVDVTTVARDGYFGASDYASLRDDKLEAEVERDLELAVPSALSEHGKRVLGIRFPPPGKMDIETKRQLRDAQRKTPRYLFRGWSNAPGYAYSGGYKDLNTPNAITPLSFFKAPGKSSQIYDLSREEMLNMARSHLRGLHLESDFSSWAASLQIAIRFANADRKEAYISILDTSKVDNVIAHVPSLLQERSSYTHEYLAHGIISGPALKAVPIKAFVDAGLPRGFEWESNIRVGLKGHPFSDSDLFAARSVADQYGKEFGAAIMIAYLCLKQRSPHLFRKGFDWRRDDILQALEGYRIPQHLCSDETVLTDIVYTKGYGEIEQMIRMLREVVRISHGRGARGLEKEYKFHAGSSVIGGYEGR